MKGVPNPSASITMQVDWEPVLTLICPLERQHFTQRAGPKVGPLWRFTPCQQQVNALYHRLNPLYQAFIKRQQLFILPVHPPWRKIHKAVKVLSEVPHTPLFHWIIPRIPWTRRKLRVQELYSICRKTYPAITQRTQKGFRTVNESSTRTETQVQGSRGGL